MESLSRALLSKCLPYDLQDELSQLIACQLGVSRDSILTSLIEYALVQLKTS